MAGNAPDPSDHWGLRERFLEFLPERERSFGENVMRYFNYWREAEGGGLTHYAAARRLIDHMSEDWGSWSRVMLEAITYEDNDSYRTRYVNFPNFVTIIIKHWVENPNHPHLPPHPGIPVESVMAPMPPPSFDQPMPLVHSPPHAPHHTPPNSPEIPYSMYWDAVYAPYGRHDHPPGFPPVPPTASQPPVAPSPPRPVAPPPSPARPRRTARMRTTNPNVGSPFRFVIPSPVHAEAGSPNDHFGSGLGSSMVSSSSGSDTSDSDGTCSGCEICLNSDIHVG